MPEGAIYVGRPTRWGNPFTIVNTPRQGFVIFDDSTPESGRSGFIASFPTREEAVVASIKMFKKHIRTLRGDRKMLMSFAMSGTLRGHDLVCWCPLDQPCHADVLLALANRDSA